MPFICKQWEVDLGEREDQKRELMRKLDHPVEDLDNDSLETAPHASKTPGHLPCSSGVPSLSGTARDTNLALSNEVLNE